MLKTKFKNIYELDEIVSNEANGVYVVPSSESTNIRVRDLVKYCRENSKESSQLSKKEIEKFCR